MFLFGLNLGPHKRVHYALRKFQGIGPATAVRLCNAAFVHPQCHVGELSAAHLDRLKPLLHAHLEAYRQERLETERRIRNRIPPILPR